MRRNGSAAKKAWLNAHGTIMRQTGLIIGKGKMRGIRDLEILWLDSGKAMGPGAFPAMSSDEDGVGGRKGV
jgi:hypothetical protein